VDTAPGLLPWPPTLAYYAVFFGFGALCFGRSEFEAKAGRHWVLHLVVALPALLLGVHLYQEGGGGSASRWLLSLCAVTYAWLMVFGLIGCFRRFFARENEQIRYLSDSSYWLYLAHLPLIIALQVWVSRWDFHHFPKFLFVCSLTFVILIIVYEYAIRYTVIGTVLNGKKTRAAKERRV
jgi:peptidoglycan/LPS O-acetylase OafA/YrhL